MSSNSTELTAHRMRIAMVVVDANEVSGLTHRDEHLPSPVVHTAIQNLLNGLRHRNDVEVFVIYGRKGAATNETRRDGSISFIPVHYQPIRSVPGMGGAFLGRALALVRAVKKLKPDVVHGQGTERESGVVAALSGFPSVITLHGHMRALARSMAAPRFSYFGIAALLERWALPKVDAVHCISTHTVESVQYLARSSRVIPNAVAPGFFEVQNQLPDHPVVVCMAGIAEWKNPRLLVHASDTLHQADPQTEVHFFGAADREHPYAAAFLRDVEGRPWCRFHGQQPPAELERCLARASCAVLPSKEENFGLALAEAMAAGVAPLGSRVGGIPDVITAGKTGWLFDSDDPRALGELLVSIHRQPGMLAQTAAAARIEAIERFSIDRVTRQHIALYRDLISQQTKY